MMTPILCSNNHQWSSLWKKKTEYENREGNGEQKWRNGSVCNGRWKKVDRSVSGPALPSSPPPLLPSSFPPPLLPSSSPLSPCYIFISSLCSNQTCLCSHSIRWKWFGRKIHQGFWKWQVLFPHSSFSLLTLLFSLFSLSATTPPVLRFPYYSFSSPFPSLTHFKVDQRSIKLPVACIWYTNLQELLWRWTNL